MATPYFSAPFRSGPSSAATTATPAPTSLNVPKISPRSVARWPLASEVTTCNGPDWRERLRPEVMPGAVKVWLLVPATISFERLATAPLPPESVPMATEPVPFATVLVPSALENSPFAVELVPTADDAKPKAPADDPSALAELPVAIE